MTDTTIRRIVWCALLTVCLTGCSSQKTSSLPIAVYHWVWHSDEYATYQDQFGDGCGHIMRRSGGRAYSADANLLANDSKMLITVSAEGTIYIVTLDNRHSQPCGSQSLSRRLSERLWGVPALSAKSRRYPDTLHRP